MSFARKLCVMALAAGLSAAGLLGTASADEAAVTVLGSGDHCVANLDTRTVACSDDATTARVDAGAVDALTIAIFYDKVDFKPGTFTWTQSRECTAGYDPEWQWGNLGDLGWNNRVSSVRTYHRCDVKLFDGVNFTGGASVWIDSSSNLGNIGGGWSNRAGSVKFS